MSEGKHSLINVERIDVDLGDAPKYAYKLVRTCLASGLYLVKPFRDRWVARTRVIEANATAETSRINVDAAIERRVSEIKGNQEVAEFEERLAARLQFQNERRQKNVECVIVGAIDFPEDTVSDEPVSVDWLAQLIENCQDVSDAEMQSIWSRILAGEVAQPGRFSLRTLHALKMLRKDDARLFTEYCAFSISIDDGNIAFCLSPESEYQVWPNELRDALKQMYVARGITSLKRLHLQALNLISIGDPAKSFHLQCPREQPAILDYHGRNFMIRHRHDDRPLQLAVDFLTDIGRELAKIAGAELNEAYQELFIRNARHGASKSSRAKAVQFLGGVAAASGKAPDGKVRQLFAN